MVKTTVQNIRSKTEKRDIVHWLQLRERVLQVSENKPDRSERDARIIRARKSEITQLLSMIKKETVRAGVRKLHQQIHIENTYSDKQKEKKNE